jgi:hypothetical protein
MMHRESSRETYDIWAITSYFNPVGYKRRLRNYREFRSRLKLPLLAVELSQSDRFELGQADAEIMIQLRCDDLLWQKERLLNIALESLPAGCRSVAWLDCDVIFEREDWAERAASLLDSYKIVLPFSHFYELPKDALPEDPDAKRMPGFSLPYAMEHGIAAPEIQQGNMRLSHHIVAAGSVLARKEFIERHGFYDACVLGSGNRAFTSAAFGRFDDAIHYMSMGPAWAEHYLAWARPFFNEVAGRITYSDGGLFHLWHGELVNRRYQERHALLGGKGFDPVKDLVLDDRGCWRWAARGKGIEQSLRDYFESRREDG